MKIINKIVSVLVLLTTALCVFGILNFKSVSASATALAAGSKISVAGVTGNLNNINVKIEFTTNVNLDGTNNALLIGLAASDDTVLTDDRFVGASTTVGVFDEDDIAIAFENAPQTIGTKTPVETNYKYTIETKDFEVKDASKDIAKLVIIGAKGAEISAEISFTEVKYSIQFGSNDAKEYSYKEVIVADALPTEFAKTISGHKQATGWDGYFSGAVATEDKTFALVMGAEDAHTWQDVALVPATTTDTGIKAHKHCSVCGADKLADDSTELVSAGDLVIPMLGHTHSYAATFVWGEKGEKPAVTFNCATCEDSHEMAAADITLVEKSHVDATCAAAGSITYTASCTYEEVEASEDKTYEVAKLAHTPVHHDSVAATLEATGNIEYWTCSGCGGYYTDALCTTATTAEAVVLAQLTLEEAQVISVSDIKPGFALMNASNGFYSYTGTATNHSVSYQFYWNASTNNFKMCGYVSKWTEEDYAQLRPSTSKAYVFGSSEKVCEKNISISPGMHLVKYTTQAIMSGDSATGKYQVTYSIDDTVLYQGIVEIPAEKIAKAGLYINGNEADELWDVKTYEAMQNAFAFSLNDISGIGNNASVLRNASWSTFGYNATTENYNRIFKFKFTLDQLTSNSYIAVDFGGTSAHSCLFLLQSGNNKNVHFCYDLDGHWSDKVWLDGQSGGSSATSFEVGRMYEVEMGRVNISTGKDFVYLKVDGNYLWNYDKPSMWYVDNNAANGKPLSNNNIQFHLVNYSIYDIDYVAPKFEEADVISVNDLYQDGYQTEPIDLATDNTFGYHATTQYGSVIFKGLVNIPASSFTDADKQGTQIRFYTGWDNSGMIWIRPDGVKIYDPDGSWGYYTGSVIPTDKDVLLEVGRLAILDEDNQFTGNFYVYVKFDGKFAIEHINDLTTEEQYTSERIFFTGNALKVNHILKNVAINKTVTFKVGEDSQDVTVLRSEFATIPQFEIPAGKRIVGWKIEGTETSFNPATDRIISDMVVVATLDDFKYKVSFGEEDLYFTPGAEIVAPANPTKASDAENHYVFAGWFDAEENAFVAGSTASADVSYTAKFNALAHSFGEWEEITAPTCTAAGSKKHACTCGYEATEEVPAVHTLVDVAAKAETCTEAGNVAYKHCTACEKNFDAEGNEIADVVIAAHHTLVDVAAKAETCEEAGNIAHRHCTVCEMNFDANGTELASVAIAAHHDLTKVEAKEKSCTKDGNVEYWNCSNCHKNFDANGSELETVVIRKGHELTKVAAKEATCEEDGNIEYFHCSECAKNFDANGAQVTNLVVPATGHSYGEWQVTKEATTEEEGSKEKVCSKCGNKITEVLPKLEKQPEEDKPVRFKGCKSSITVSIISSITLLAAAGFVFKKKKENE